MADRELVAYLKKNLKKFGAEALRDRLLEEGVPESDINEAMRVVSKPERKKTDPVIYILFAVTMLGIGIYFTMDFTHHGARPNSNVNNNPEKMFMGHYGYVLKTPDGYSTLSDFKDPQRTKEVVYLFPKGLDASNLMNEGLYVQLGILRLEVSPRRVPEGKIGMDAVRAGVTTILRNRKAVFTSQEVQVGGLPAFLVSITQPFPLAQAFVVGTKVLYVLTGGAQDQLFNDTLNSLHETSIDERPNSQ